MRIVESRMSTPNSLQSARVLARGALHRRYRLMNEEATPPFHNALPAGLIGMIAIALVIEILVARHWNKLISPAAFGWADSARRAKIEAPGSEILIAGDSLIQVSVYPRIIEAATGQTALNLGAGAAPATLTEFLLRRAYDFGAKPSAIVFDFKPSLLLGGPEYFTQRWAESQTTLETIEFIVGNRDVRLLQDVITSVFLPSFRWRAGLREALRSALDGRQSETVFDNALHRRNWTVNRGANVGANNTKFNGTISEPEHFQLCSHRFRSHHVNVKAARRIVGLAVEKGIRPYLVITPLPPALHERRRISGSDSAYTAFVRTLQDEFPALTVLDGRESGYPWRVFLDPTHLDRTGAVTLSTDVAAILRTDLEAVAPAKIETKRWLGLPRFQELTEPTGIETTDQSTAWLEANVDRE